MSATLYEKYGGFGSISRLVMAFYDKMLDSDEVGHYFDDVDLKRLIDHQTKFVAYLLGGPADYTGERLAALHAHLKISGGDFDEMKRLLGDALTEHGFEDGDRDAVLGVIESHRDRIVQPT